MFFQKEPYFTGDKIKVMKLKDRELTENIACYFITIMKKAFQKFAWGQSSFNENILKNIIIELPTKNEQIDYEYMERYIQVIKKLAIKNVVIWKDKIINKTKEII